MKPKIENAVGIFFLSCFIFIAAISICLPESEPDPVRQRIKEESMISGGFGGY